MALKSRWRSGGPWHLTRDKFRLLRRLTTVLTLTMRPSTRYCPSLSSGLALLYALWNICHSETPDKESFSRVAKFLKIHGEILEVEQELYASFRRVRVRLHDCSRNGAWEWSICFQCFLTWYISLKWYLPTFCSAERAFSAHALRRVKRTSFTGEKCLRMLY